VLESLAGKVAPSSAIVKAVPRGKIEANDLSESVATLIKSGMSPTAVFKYGDAPRKHWGKRGSRR